MFFLQLVHRQTQLSCTKLILTRARTWIEQASSFILSLREQEQFTLSSSQHSERTMEKLDYNIGVQSVFVQTSCQRRQVLRHGDDFATLATRTQIAEFEEDLSKQILVEHIATLGPRPQLLDACEVRFLNRVIRWVVQSFRKAPERIEIEADPRHSELLIKNSGLQTNSKGVNTPGERTRDSSRTLKLSSQDSTSYRSDVMRLACLSADRMELQFASKELARSMAEPTTADVVEALADHMLQRLKLCRMSAEQEEHEFMQDIPRETSLEIYVDNTGGCQPLEC